MYYTVNINCEGIKIPRLNRWPMETADYNITFVNIKSKDNVGADAISRLKTLNVCKKHWRIQKH